MKQLQDKYEKKNTMEAHSALDLRVLNVNKAKLLTKEKSVLKSLNSSYQSSMYETFDI
jgi:hypothetical protein